MAAKSGLPKYFQSNRCFGGDSEELQVPIDAENLREDEGGGNLKREMGENGSKVNSCNGELQELRESQKNRTVDEVLRLKEILDCDQEKAGAIVYETLRHLQMMNLSYEILKETQIGWSVKSLIKHKSQKIRHLVRTLIKDWRGVVDEWIDSMTAISDQSPDYVNPATPDEEEGLPCPPMDEGELLFIESCSFLSSEQLFLKFLDGKNYDEAFGISEMPITESHGHTRRQEQSNAHPKNQGIVNIQQNSNNSEKEAFRTKLELTKRKLHDGYQQEKIAKKQRAIQIVELQDLPKEQLEQASDKKPGLKKSMKKAKNSANARR